MAATLFRRRGEVDPALQARASCSARCARNFLLMSATPHNGKEADFQLFMGLLDADRFEGRFREGVHKADVSDMMRRLTKEELLPLRRHAALSRAPAYTASYELSPTEADLYQAVTDYVREEMNRADQIRTATSAAEQVGFALADPAAPPRLLAGGHPPARSSAAASGWKSGCGREAAAARSRCGAPQPDARAARAAIADDLDEAPEDEVEAARRGDRRSGDRRADPRRARSRDRHPQGPRSAGAAPEAVRRRTPSGASSTRSSTSRSCCDPANRPAAQDPDLHRAQGHARIPAAEDPRAHRRRRKPSS